MTNIHYKITSINPLAHIFNVELTLNNANPKGQKLRLPTWIPGSYMIRDFAKNIIEIKARANQQAIELTQLDKSTWQLDAFNAPTTIVVEYSVYAWDLSVRTAHLDQTHGFFNGTSVFLEVIGQAEQPCKVTINKPKHEQCVQWKCATSLDQTNVNKEGFGEYEAQNYDDLIDHPVEMAAFKTLSFSACGIPHDIVLTGQLECDEQRVINDLTIICEHHIRFFGEPAPVKRYLFLIMVVGDGYGGLEHRASTSLLISRKNLPQIGQNDVNDDYRSFLGLCSHEYFHTWNVKRMKPAVFLDADLSNEVYTPLLWAFEGITSYYDDLALVRTGLIDEESYYELLAQTITRVFKTKGRLKQTIAESSFNAWTKFYKQDENASNAIISYYAKGTLVALCLDLIIRQDSQNKFALDDIMRQLWQDYLKGNAGFNDDTIQNKMEQLLNKNYADLFNTLIYSTEELPLVELLKTVGVDLNTVAQASQSDKGGKVSPSPAKSEFGAILKQNNAFITLTSMTENGAAQSAGLSAGDQVVAINKLQLNVQQLEQLLCHKAEGETLSITAFRRDELMTFEVVLTSAQKNTAVLSNTKDTAKMPISWPNALN